MREISLTKGWYKAFELHPVRRYLGCAKTEQEALLLKARED